MRGADRVVVRDGEAIGALLTRMGAQDTRLTWEERRMRREVRATANRLANFDDANLRRSARAAVAAAARVERALEILGDTVPDHLAAAGKLRVEHRQASLEELGRLADPPMTKDAVAGRIRRLLSMADRKAKQDGIPDTESAVTPDLLEDCMRAIQPRRPDLRYIDAGPAGRAGSVLLHGFPQFNTSWTAVIKRLTAKVIDAWRPISGGTRRARDQPGARDYVVPELVEDVRALLDAVGRHGCTSWVTTGARWSPGEQRKNSAIASRP